MVWKIVNVDSPGNATVYGGNDITKINKLLSGYDLQIEDTSDEVDIDTQTSFSSDKFRIKSPTTGFNYIFRGKDITADRVISLPLMDDDGEISLSATSAVNDWGAYMQTFRHQNIKIMNPANTFGYLFNSSAIAANRNITLPLLTADDTIVFANATQTLANKTLTAPTISSMTVNTDSNTIKHSTTNNAGDLLINTGTKYDRFARGGANQVPIMNATGTGMTWIDKTSLQGEPGAPGESGTGDYQFPIVNNIATGTWFGTTPAGADGLWNQFLTNVSTASYTNITDTSGRMGLRYTLNGDDMFAGFKTNNVYFTRNNDPELWVRYKFDVNSQDFEYRVAIGFIDDMSASLQTGTNNLSNYRAFMWYFEDVDSDINVGRNDGDTTTDRDNTVSVPYTDTGIHTIRLIGDSVNNRFGISLDGANATYYTSEIPAATTRLGCMVQFINDDSNTRYVELYGAYFRAKVI